MSKEFQAFNKKYAKIAGTALKLITSYGGSIAKEDIQGISQWELLPGQEFREDYPAERVRWAVYEHPGAEKWQEFRVSLKGLNTKEKLYALAWWFGILEMLEPQELIRLNNYLGALKRSGHLDSSLRVVKL